MKKIILGIYLSEDLAQVVALEQDGSSNLLRAITEWPSTLFNYAGDDTPGVDEFVERMSAFLAAHNLKPQMVSVALDSSLLFINSVPVSQNATRSDIDEQVEWELKTYFPDSPRDSFISDMHVLSGTGKVNNVMMVSARNDLVQKLYRSLSRLRLGLDIVDVDHFSVDNALRFNFPETSNKLIALIGLKRGRMDTSYIRYNDLEAYSYALYSLPEEAVAQIGKVSNDTKGLSSISIYGTHLSADSLGQIRNVSAVPVEALNPLRSVQLSSSVRANINSTFASYRYCAAVGAALRRD
ncbi:MAG: pilus assembly protein PilM [bacterium]